MFSFHPVKIITTGEGERLQQIQTPYMISYVYLDRMASRVKKHHLKNKEKPDWYYEQVLLGYNYRMTDIQAALGVSQMRKLDKYVKRRHEIAALYNANENNYRAIRYHRCNIVLIIYMF